METGEVYHQGNIPKVIRNLEGIPEEKKENDNLTKINVLKNVLDLDIDDFETFNLSIIDKSGPIHIIQQDGTSLPSRYYIF